MDSLNKNNMKTKYTMKVATLNIRTLTDCKSIDLIDVLEDYHIDILGLTETNSLDKRTKYLFSKQNKYTTIFRNEDLNFRGKGVGIIINKRINRYIKEVKKFNNRIISIDFQFKKDKKLRIITYYGIVRNSALNQPNLDLHLRNQIINLVSNGKREGYEIILLGDFNVQYELYKENIKQSKKKYRYLKNLCVFRRKI